MLESPVGRVVEGHAGDLCSVLGILGAATLVINRGPKAPLAELVGERLVMGSVGAGALDTAIQARNVVKDDGRGAKRRGNHKSDWGSVVYAATGLIPGASLRALRGLHPSASVVEKLGVAVLGVNGTVLGYEILHRVPKMAHGEENASGYGSFLASLGGFVVARRALMR